MNIATIIKTNLQIMGLIKGKYPDGKFPAKLTTPEAKYYRTLQLDIDKARIALGEDQSGDKTPRAD